MAVRVICIDDKNRPQQIPADKWPKQDEQYTIDKIFMMVNQGGIQGCSLNEFDISNLAPYNCYRLNRFAINIEDMPEFIEMLKKKAPEKSVQDMNDWINGLEVTKTKETSKQLTEEILETA